MAAIPPSQPYVNHQAAAHPFKYEGVVEMVPVEAAATLLIRHLPEAISHDTLSRLFSHYGASSVCPCTSGKMRNCAFVTFKNEAFASQAQRQLNGVRFLGKVLSAERASKHVEDRKHQQGEPQLAKDSVSSMKDVTADNELSERSTFKSAAKEPIAERLGVDYPFPPHLEYAYPPPDGNILTNIVNALIAVPRFYTQVLHLMNKMNIPAPFRMALPTPPLPPSVPVPPPPPPPPSLPPLAAKSQEADESSDGSEMESSDDEVDGIDYSTGIPGVVRPKRKRTKRESIVGPAVDKDVVHEAVGLKPATLVPKEIPLIKKKIPVLQIKMAPKRTQNEEKDDETVEELLEADTENSDLKPYATPQELESGKLPPEEILSLPMFKNYSAGNPAPVLYIKNLAKDVVNDDFYFIFGSLFGSIDRTKSSLSVKLMKEGRMRGQAFVTFPSVELAHHALNLVNGYVYKGKPMIIQFGRNPATAKSN